MFRNVSYFSDNHRLLAVFLAVASHRTEYGSCQNCEHRQANTSLTASTNIIDASAIASPLLYSEYTILSGKN